MPRIAIIVGSTRPNRNDDRVAQEGCTTSPPTAPTPTP